MTQLLAKCHAAFAAVRRYSPIRLLLSGILATLLIGAMSFFMPGFLAEKTARPPFRLIEVRAVSDDGQLLPGALVKLGKSKEGLTDTFGEWRRFIRIKEGSQLSVKLTKPGKDGYWYGYRRLQVGKEDSPKNQRYALGITMRWISKPLAKEDSEFGEEYIVSDTQEVLNRKAAPAEMKEVKGLKNASVTAPHVIGNHVAVFFDGSALEVTDREARQRFLSGENALEKSLTQQGYQLDRTATLQLHVSAVAGEKAARWLEVRLLWSAQNKMQEVGELMTFAEKPEDFARSINQFLEREYPARWQAEVNAKGTVFIRLPLTNRGPASLSIGDMVQDSSLQKGRVEMASIRGQSLLITLGRVDADFCRDTTRCDVRKSILNRERPFTLHSVTLDVPDARVYVGGRLAKPLGRQAFEYWGQAGRNYPVTVVKSYAVVGHGSAVAPLKEKVAQRDRAVKAQTRKR